MIALLPIKTSQSNKQHAFILLPVVLTLTILASVAYLLSREGAINAGNVNRELQHDAALYTAKAGYQHAVWKINRQNCNGYADIPDTTIGQHNYFASFTDNTGATLTAGSPANITVVGTHLNGASHTINRYREKIYQYPQTTVTFQLGTDSGKDAPIFANYFLKGLNYGEYKQRVSTTWLSHIHQLIQVDLITLPLDAIIISAQLELKQIQTINAAANAKIDVHRILQSWVEGSKTGSGSPDGATWNTFDGSVSWDGGGGGSYDSTAIASTIITSDNIVRSWDITSLVQGWHNDLYANEGILLKGVGDLNVSFASKEDANTADRPKLIIIYACECGKTCSTEGVSPPAKKIYWTDDLANKIQQSDEDGSNVEDVIKNLNRPTGLDIDTVNNKIYWTNGLQLQRANLDGSNLETIYSGSIVTFDIKLDVGAGKMYWTHDNGISRVMRANLDGSNSQIINTTLNRPSYISLDISAGHLYLTSFEDGTVSRMNLDGSNSTKLVSGAYGPIGNAIDLVNGKIYWTGGATFDWIKRADLDGNNVEKIVTGLNAPEDIVYDADNDRIYWVDALNVLVQRSDSDGSNVETLVSTNMTRPRGIILVNADDVMSLSTPPVPCSGNFRDEFNTISFAGSDGSLIWKTDWQEVGETDDANSGDIRVMKDNSNYQLRLRDNDNGGEGVARELDLSGASLVKLGLKYRRSGLDKTSDYVSVEISSSGLSGPWVERARFVGTSNDSSYQSWSYTLDISEISANTAIRLRTSSTMGGSDIIYFDDIEFQCSP